MARTTAHYHSHRPPSPTPSRCWSWRTSRSRPSRSASDLAALRELVEANASFASVSDRPVDQQPKRAARCSQAPVRAARSSPLLLQLPGRAEREGPAGAARADRRGVRATCSTSSSARSRSTSPSPTSSRPSSSSDATQRISQALEQDAVVHQYVDESIIGGMVLRVGDQLIDASVRNQLEQRCKEKLLAAKPK